MRVMSMIKGEPQPGAAPSEELLAAMGRYNDELKEAGVLIDLAGLLPSAEGRRVRFAEGDRTVIEGPFAESKKLIAGYWISRCSRWTRPSNGPSGSPSRRGPGSTPASTAPRPRSRSVGCLSRRGSTHPSSGGERFRGGPGIRR